MIVAHIGPPLARTGGPAGVLLQLKSGLSRTGSGGHIVRLPPVAVAPAQSPPSLKARMLAPLRRVRRGLFGEPRFYRPNLGALRQTDGEAARMLEEIWRAAEGCAEPLLADARDADLLIAHDVPIAAMALAARRPHQQVWLVVHAPMPFALYHLWCWAVPEQDWRDVLSFPGVQRFIDRELEVWRAVDRVFTATPDALDELGRSDARFMTAGNMVYGLTGASAPAGSTETSVGALRKRFGLPLDQPIGLFLGQALPYRAFDSLLEAVDLLPSPVAIPGLIAVAGPPVEKVPIHKRLRALGPVSAVSDLLHAVDFFININRFNLFDLSIIEASEAGLPLLLHATGGNRTFATLGAGCVMIDSIEPAAIARGIETMFTMPPVERRALGQRSRACYDAHLTVDHHARRHLALYDEASIACTTYSS
jgi:glycosyltransferase involved in cell wall biosynthesis